MFAPNFIDVEKFSYTQNVASILYRDTDDIYFINAIVLVTRKEISEKGAQYYLGFGNNILPLGDGTTVRSSPMTAGEIFKKHPELPNIIPHHDEYLDPQNAEQPQISHPLGPADADLANLLHQFASVKSSLTGDGNEIDDERILETIIEALYENVTAQDYGLVRPRSIGNQIWGRLRF